MLTSETFTADCAALQKIEKKLRERQRTAFQNRQIEQWRQISEQLSFVQNRLAWATGPKIRRQRKIWHENFYLPLLVGSMQEWETETGSEGEDRDSIKMDDVQVHLIRRGEPITLRALTIWLSVLGKGLQRDKIGESLSLAAETIGWTSSAWASWEAQVRALENVVLEITAERVPFGHYLTVGEEVRLPLVEIIRPQRPSARPWSQPWNWCIPRAWNLFLQPRQAVWLPQDTARPSPVRSATGLPLTSRNFPFLKAWLSTVKLSDKTYASVSG